MKYINYWRHAIVCFVIIHLTITIDYVQPMEKAEFNTKVKFDPSKDMYPRRVLEKRNLVHMHI